MLDCVANSTLDPCVAMYNEYIDAGQNNDDDKNTWRTTSHISPEQQQEIAQFRQQQLQQQRSLQALNATLAQFWEEQMREVCRLFFHETIFSKKLD